MKLFIFVLLLMLNCITLPQFKITFTQTPTAAEKQMIGEDRNIEKDGWIISSIKTSASGADVWKKEVLEVGIPDADLDEDTFISLRRISYLSGEIREFKKKGFIGEAGDGKIKINPNIKETLDRDDFPKQKDRIETIISMVNESRAVVLKKRLYVLSLENLKEAELAKRKNDLLLTYYQMTEAGEYFENPSGKWNRKE
jgi:hypothetical protein